MHVLLLAPQPFLIERGTPLAVLAVAAALCENGHTVDLVSFHGGRDVALAGLRQFRIKRPAPVKTVPVGMSWQKLVCNASLFALALRLVRRGRYDCIHAVEDSVFLALLLRPLARAPVVYDMDSIMSDQIAEKWPRLRPLAPALRAVERVAMRASDAVLCVCPALAQRVREDAPATPHVVLHDYPLWDATADAPRLRAEVEDGRLLALYVGNLQHYQGIDLLVEAAGLLPAGSALDVVVVGELPADGRFAKVGGGAGDGRLANGVGLRFFGPLPLACLPGALVQADVLVSPRLHGVNTPMKIYSYMMAGRAILATSILSHTQVLDADCALLAEPTAAALAEGLLALAADPALRARLGAAARERAVTRYSKARHAEILLGAYARLPARGGTPAGQCGAG